MLETVRAARRVSALADATGPATIRPLAAAARFSLRLRETDAAAIGAVAGFRVNQRLNSFVVDGERLSLRLGPDEWLLIAAEADSAAIAAEIAAALGDRFHALVDIGHRHVAIAVHGPHAADILNAGCPLDLFETSFPTGMATRTVLGKVEIILMRLDDAPTYRVECWRSFSTYVHGFLVEAARDFEATTG